jgi:very-short-patch-repair endonuclease
MGLKERLSAAKKKPKFPPGHFDQLPALYRFGLNFDQLGSVFGCSHWWARTKLLQMGVELRKVPTEVGYGEQEVYNIACSLGLKPTRQYPVNRHAIDVAIESERLAVEVLGQYPHIGPISGSGRYATKRKALQSLGWKILWVDASKKRDVCIECVGQAILAVAADKSDEFKQWVRSDGTEVTQLLRDRLADVTKHRLSELPVFSITRTH